MLALTGFHYSAVSGTLTLASRPGRWFWASGYAWGSVAIEPATRANRVRLDVAEGAIDLADIVVGGPGRYRLPARRTLTAGDHLDVEVPVTLAEAALGAKVDVPTPRGTISLRIPPCSSSGRKLRVKGHGVAAKGREPGDLFAELQIVLPATLDEESQELVRKLEARFDSQQAARIRQDLQW